MGILQESIDEVREKTKIEDIVGADVELKPGGMDSLKGLCPFHDERTPSFHVRPSMHTWHCFGCGEGGDVISYVRKSTGMGFAEAVEYLADKAGITLKRDDKGYTPKETGPRLQRLREANTAASLWLTQRLVDMHDTSEAAHARAFIAARNIKPQTAVDWGAGYAPRDSRALIDHLRHQGFTTDEIVAAGLAAPNQRGGYRPFVRGRLTWAIRDTTGQVIGFGARRLDDVDEWGAKFLNTSETPLYKKSRVLFGVDQARKRAHEARSVYVVEGYTDVVAAHIAGVTNTVAPCGTAFTEDQMRFLHRTVGDDGLIVMCLDGDEAGLQGARRAFDLAQAIGHTRTEVTVLPNGQDPNDILIADGPQALAHAMQEHQPITQFVLDATIDASPAGRPDATDEDRVVARDQVLPILATITDDTLRRRYAEKAAARIGLPAAAITTRLTAAQPADTRVPLDTPGVPEATRPPAAPGLVEQEIVTALVHDESTARHAVSLGLTPNAFTTNPWKALMGAVQEALDQPTSIPWLTRLERVIPERGHSILTACLCEPSPRTGHDLDIPIARLLAEARSRAVSTAPVVNPADLDELAALRRSALKGGAL